MGAVKSCLFRPAKCLALDLAERQGFTPTNEQDASGNEPPYGAGGQHGGTDSCGGRANVAAQGRRWRTHARAAPAHGLEQLEQLNRGI